MSSTPIDPAIEQVVEQIMQGTQLNVSISPGIKDQQEYVTYDQRKDVTLANEKFVINPVNTLKLTVKHMNNLSSCNLPNIPCKMIDIRISNLRWQPGIAPNEGFWLPMTYIGITAVVNSNGKSNQKACIVAGSGPSRWMIWVSNYNLTSSFQIAVRNALTKAFICILTPDSQYNIVYMTPIFAARSFEL
ncbi:MAG: hypothetical protein WBR15_03300 [Gammaproteobacteria bacterium]